MVAVPYRARPDGPSARFGLFPLLPPRLLILVGVLAVIVGSLHVFLWSRVVHIQCERAVTVSCDVEESSLALTNRTRVAAGDATRAELRGAVSRSRGDVWIVLVGADGETELTSGFNGDKHGQRRVTEKISGFLRSHTTVVEAGFGDRWFTAWVFLVVFGGLFILTYPFFGYRVRVTIDRGQGTMTIERGVWPFVGRSALPLASFTGFGVEGESRVRLVANVKGQSPVPCTYRIAHRPTVGRAADRLNAWLRAQSW